MVTSEDGKSVPESDFEAHQEGDCLDWVVTSIDIISHEQIICLGRLSSNTEELLEIMELAVNVSANSHGCTHNGHVAFED